jgi:hypothetical protein
MRNEHDANEALYRTAPRHAPLLGHPHRSYNRPPPADKHEVLWGFVLAVVIAVSLAAVLFYRL